MNDTWTPKGVADGILRLAAGLLVLAAIAFGILGAGSWLYTKATAPAPRSTEWDQYKVKPRPEDYGLTPDPAPKSYTKYLEKPPLPPGLRPLPPGFRPAKP